MKNYIQDFSASCSQMTTELKELLGQLRDRDRGRRRDSESEEEKQIDDHDDEREEDIAMD